MRSVVAVTPDGTVVGHCAVFVERKGDPVPESGRLVVDPRYRGHHLAERMATVRRELAGEHGFPGIWAEAVTNHPSSQREVIKLGGVEVGLLIGGSPAAVRMAGFANANEGRRSLIVTYTPLAPVARTIHVPERHAAIVGELAGAAGTRARDRDGGVRATAGHARISTKVTPQTGVAHVRVAHAGADLASKVADELEGLDAFDLGAVHLDVPLDEPARRRGDRGARGARFRLRGLDPRLRADGDIVRLQRVGSHPVDVEHVVCARPGGRGGSRLRRRRMAPRAAGRNQLTSRRTVRTVLYPGPGRGASVSRGAGGHGHRTSADRGARR